MVELRCYQSDLLRKTDKALESPNARVMMQLPTGGGKTHIAAALMSGRLKDGVKAVWLTHRRELASQTEGMLRQAGIPAASNIRWSPGIEALSIVNGVVILMAQTVSRRTARANVWDVYDSKDILIIDEAHHATADGWARAINQWPGSALGMTATPWRLSQREGFDHLFEELVCGPQLAALQADGWLCRARVMVPPEENQILGGRVDTTGDYNESGIEQANEDRDIWTAGALRFWRQHGENRQTVLYAVSVRHARNLAGVFNDAGIPAGVLLGDTPDTERADLISRFKDGGIRVLINVAVATEGFDLPDAACVVLSRPTMSLSLYLQMVGRGLRPKPDGGDCVVLDMAGNSFRHGLPEEDREWSLKPRGATPPGEYRVSRCPVCEAVSPAASHYCRNCGEPFGEECRRCGAWRAMARWSRKTACGDAHELVCDLCHYDAHIQAHLPVTEELEELAMLADGDELSPNRDSFLKDLLEEELRRVGGAVEERKSELRSFIEARESEMTDDDELDKSFEDYLDGLTVSERPQTFPQKYRLFGKWEAIRNQELAAWRDELVNLEESHPLDKQLVYNNARNRLMRLFDAEARDVGLIAGSHNRETPHNAPDGEQSTTGTSVKNSRLNISVEPETSSGPARQSGLQLTHTEEYVSAVLESLVALGGSATTSRVLDEVERKMEAKLTTHDREPMRTNPSTVRWRHQAQLCMYGLARKRGFLKSSSPLLGFWEITDSGIRYLEGLDSI